MGDPSLQSRKSHAYPPVSWSWRLTLVFLAKCPHPAFELRAWEEPGWELPCSWPVLCSGGLSRVRERGRDVTGAGMSPCTRRPCTRISRPTAAQRAGEQ